MKKLILSIIAICHFAYGDAHVFIYHRFNDFRHQSTSISNENLRAQFEYFKTKGYEVIPLSRLVEALKNNEEISDKWVVLTIDDGYKSFYEHGLPIFKEYGYPFSMMIYVEASDKKYGDYMDFSQLKEISEFGELGYHSYAHPHMVSLSDEELRADFEKGINGFEKHLGFKPKYFAYPFGEYNDKIKQISLEYGLEVLLNQNSGAVSNQSELSDIDRTPLMDGTSLSAALASKFLKAKWLSPVEYPKSGIIQQVKIQTDENATKGYLYATNHGTQKVEVNDGLVDVNVGKNVAEHVHKNHIRILLNINGKTTTKILVKDKKNVK